MPPRCPYCQSPVGSGDVALRCPVCDATHHADCFSENGGCAVYGCGARPTDIPSAPQMAEPVSARQTLDLMDLEPTDLPRVTYPQGFTPPRSGRGLSETEQALILLTVIIAIAVIIVLVVALG